MPIKNKLIEKRYANRSREIFVSKSQEELESNGYEIRRYCHQGSNDYFLLIKNNFYLVFLKDDKGSLVPSESVVNKFAREIDKNKIYIMFSDGTVRDYVENE